MLRAPAIAGSGCPPRTRCPAPRGTRGSPPGARHAPAAAPECATQRRAATAAQSWQPYPADLQQPCSASARCCHANHTSSIGPFVAQLPSLPEPRRRTLMRIARSTRTALVNTCRLLCAPQLGRDVPNKFVYGISDVMVADWTRARLRDRRVILVLFSRPVAGLRCAITLPSPIYILEVYEHHIFRTAARKTISKHT